MFRTSAICDETDVTFLSQRLFTVLTLAQLGRKTELEKVVAEFRAMDPHTRTLERETRGTCAAAKCLLMDGALKAGLL